MKRFPALTAIAASMCLAACTAGARVGEATAGVVTEGVSLIPREVLFGNPEKTNVRMSLDGKRISYLAPVDGVLNVWVADAATPDRAKPVTDDKKRGIRYYGWTYAPQYLWYVQDSDGDENWHVYVIDVEKNEVKDLTPFAGVRALVSEASPKHPTELLLAINKRDKRMEDLYRVDIVTGALEEVERNLIGLLQFFSDEDFHTFLAARYTPDGGLELLERNGDEWRVAVNVGMADAAGFEVAGHSADGNLVYLGDPRGRNTAAFVRWDRSKDTFEALSQNERADLEMSMFHPTKRTPQAVSFNYERRSWVFFDDAVKADFATLAEVDRGDFFVVSRTLDDSEWMVVFVPDNGPQKYYHYDRNSDQATFLFADRPELESQPLAKMYPVVIKARDGLNLVSYYTLPVAVDDNGNAKQPVPMVLAVHGGPWGRNEWGYNPSHQWLANRGYAVLSVNYRSSTGFGKDFVNAGNMEWAGKMHDDLLDAVAWAVDNGITKKDEVAIMGGSYGGYATLVGLTFTPKEFACGVDIVGPSNLVTLLENMPAYWMPIAPMLTSRMGNHKTEEGRKLLESRSPLFKADAIERPLLIGQGANDPRVPQMQADQIVTAMKKNNIPVTYVVYADEGHGFRRPENKKSFNAITEAFLAGCLGGRAEPVGSDFQGASFTVPEGAVHVPGLANELNNLVKSP